MSLAKQEKRGDGWMERPRMDGVFRFYDVESRKTSVVSCFCSPVFSWCVCLFWWLVVGLADWAEVLPPRAQERRWPLGRVGDQKPLLYRTLKVPLLSARLASLVQGIAETS